jgi:hypothetical protein
MKPIHDFLRNDRGSEALTGALSVMLPHLELRRKAEDNLRSIVPFYRNMQDPQAQFLFLFFVYLITLEGVFDQSVRAIFALSEYVQGRQATFPTPHSMSLSDLKDQLSRSQAVLSSDTLFEGYSNHIRNAIAHTYFSYDQQRDRMVLEDHEPRSGALSFGPIQLSRSDFLNDYYGKLEAVNTYLSFLFGLGRVDDLTRMTNAI